MVQLLFFIFIICYIFLSPVISRDYAAFLNLLNEVDGICLLSHRVMDLGQLTLHLEEKINRRNTTVISLTGHPKLPLYEKGCNIEGVE